MMRPTTTSQTIAGRVRIGSSGSRGLRSISPAAAGAQSPAWKSIVVKLIQRVCSIGTRHDR